MKYKIIASVFLFFVAVLTVSAQKTPTIRSFSLTNDHISSNDRRKDLNGNPCALLKVQVVDEISRVEGNKIGAIVNKGVEKWIYMCKGSRNIRIHFKNHLPLKVMFQDYQINGLEGNRVYELVLEIPDFQQSVSNGTPSQTPIEKKTQKLVINYTPQDATVMIDSKLYRGNGKIEATLPIGDHDYLIAATGYITVEGSLRLSENAPRVITESLVFDGTVATGNDNTVAYNPKTPNDKGILNEASNEKKTTKQKKNIKQSKATQDTEVKGNNDVIFEPSKENDHIAHSSNEDDLNNRPKPVQLNKSFKYTYDGVVFKCKAKKGYVTITGFDTNAITVVIPSTVMYGNNYYPVTTIDTYSGGNNYAVSNMIIQDGVEYIKKYAFMLFYNLSDVTLPKTIKRVGTRAFRNKQGMKIKTPQGISEEELRKGNEVIVK